MGARSILSIVTGSEPRLSLVIQVGCAELLRQDPLLRPASINLQRKQNDEAKQQPRFVCPENQSRYHQAAKDINWIADAGIEAGGYQRACLGLHAEGPSQLNAGQGEQQERRNCNGQSGDSRNCPRRPPGIHQKDQEGDSNQCQRSVVEFQEWPPHYLDSAPYCCASARAGRSRQPQNATIARFAELKHSRLSGPAPPSPTVLRGRRTLMRAAPQSR